MFTTETETPYVDPTYICNWSCIKIMGKVKRE